MQPSNQTLFPLEIKGTLSELKANKLALYSRHCGFPKAIVTLFVPSYLILKLLLGFHTP